MKKNFLKKSLVTILLASASLLPINSKAQGIPGLPRREPIDLFSQPQDTSLNYYGSGDLDSNNVIDWNDYNLMQSKLNASLDDLKDINGDGEFTLNDSALLGQYLRKQITHLPSQWNYYDTTMNNEQIKQNKTNWYNKMHIIADIYNSYQNYNYLCGDWSIQTSINFYGDKSFEYANEDDYGNDFSQNNRFNLPMFEVSSSTSTFAHGYNVILLGDDLFDFNSWRFLDNMYNDSDIHMGDAQMPLDDTYIIAIESPTKIQNGSMQDDGVLFAFQIENGVPEYVPVNYIHPRLFKTNPSKDKIAPKLIISSPQNNKIYNNLNINLKYSAIPQQHLPIKV